MKEIAIDGDRNLDTNRKIEEKTTQRRKYYATIESPLFLNSRDDAKGMHASGPKWRNCLSIVRRFKSKPRFYCTK